NMPRKYRFIYTKLERNDAYLVGHIAYAIYKSEKIKYIEQLKAGSTDDVEEDDLKPFHDICSSVDNIAKYRFMASHILRSFLDNTLTESIQNMERECIENHSQILSDIIEPLKPKRKWILFWHGVIQSVAGAFIFALLVAAFIFIKNYQGA
ncbi:MAG: hypothetical protein K2K08_03510, partial [Paramuribaculum sp.]|nr:hypothetical protein [Paramuribaculum sp.]